MTRLTRETNETRITVTLDLGGGAVEVITDDDFLSHMVVTLARYAGLGLTLKAVGDLRHHLVEDVAITLGLALRRAMPDSSTRYGDATIPMDDALVRAAVDLGGRPWYEGRLPSPLYEHFLQSLAVNLQATVHLRVLRGTDRHHMVEAAVKAFGLALRQAMAREEGVFSTKGSVSLDWGA